MRVRSLSIAALSACAACYDTIPITSQQATPGLELQVDLSDNGAQHMAALLGPGTVSVKGRLAQAVNDSLHLAVTTTTLQNGEDRMWKSELVTIPMSDVAHVGEYRLSKPRTVVVVASVVLGAIAARMGFSGSVGTKSSRNPPAGQ